MCVQQPRIDAPSFSRRTKFAPVSLSLFNFTLLNVSQLSWRMETESRRWEKERESLLIQENHQKVAPKDDDNVEDLFFFGRWKVKRERNTAAFISYWAAAMLHLTLWLWIYVREQRERRHHPIRGSGSPSLPLAMWIVPWMLLAFNPLLFFFFFFFFLFLLYDAHAFISNDQYMNSTHPELGFTTLVAAHTQGRRVKTNNARATRAIMKSTLESSNQLQFYWHKRTR